MRVRAVLFDLDDTLFDHAHATSHALAVLQGAEPAFGAWTRDRLRQRHGAILEAMHGEVLAGRLSIPAAREGRFRRLLDEAGAPASGDGRPAELARRYREAYESAWQPVPGAVAVLDALRRDGVRIAIVTNNVHVEQALKLELCGLEPLVDVLITSERAGVAKPDARIFVSALEALEVDRVDTVMVGDAWRTDIEGALAAGIRPIWFNRLGEPPPAPGVEELRTWEPVAEAVRTLRENLGSDTGQTATRVRHLGFDV